MGMDLDIGFRSQLHAVRAAINSSWLTHVQAEADLWRKRISDFFLFGVCPLGIFIARRRPFTTLLAHKTQITRDGRGEQNGDWVDIRLKLPMSRINKCEYLRPINISNFRDIVLSLFRMTTICSGPWTLRRVVLTALIYNVRQTGNGHNGMVALNLLNCQITFSNDHFCPINERGNGYSPFVISSRPLAVCGSVEELPTLSCVGLYRIL